MRNEKLESLLVETQEKLSVYVAKDDGKQIKTQVVISGSEKKTLEEMQLELEDQRELAANRMAELENMENNYKDCLKEVEKLKMDLSTLPEYVVVETTEHKCLQSQFSVLYNEAMQLKTQVLELSWLLETQTYFHFCTTSWRKREVSCRCPKTPT